MGQHLPPEPNPYRHKDLELEQLEEMGTPVYEGTGLSVRALTAEELQRFLDAHAGQPAQPLGSGWASLDSLGATGQPPGPPPAPVRPAAGSLGSPGRSALAQYRRRRGEELDGWTRSLVWRTPLVAAAGLVVGALASQAGLAGTLATLAGLAGAALVSWRLRFKPSEQARAWQHGAHGEQQTARQLDRLYRDGYQVLHDLAMPDSAANIDHLVIGPTGAFVIDSKLWTGQVHQSADGLIWHNHYRLDRTLGTVRWQALTVGRLLGVPVAPLICVHEALVQGGGLRAQGVAIVPAALLRAALGYDRVFSDAAVRLLASTAWTRLRPAT